MNDITKTGGSTDLLEVVEDLNERLSGQAATTRGIIEAMKQERSERRQLATRLDRIEQEGGQVGAHWTVAAWISLHDYRATKDAMKEEGGILRGICMQNNFAIPDRKVCNGGNFPARQWPIEAIRIWWPGCCARHGWKLVWKA